MQTPELFPELFIARHGQTEWNLQHRMQGNLNSALTDLGRAQALRLRGHFAKACPANTRYISSPQIRTLHTAAIALEGITAEVTTDKRLREIDVGSWQGQSSHDIKASLDPESLTHMLHYYDFAPMGEGFAGLRARCTDFLRELDGPTAIITHGITSRMIRLIALGMGDDQLSELPGGQGIVFHIRGDVQKILD